MLENLMSYSQSRGAIRLMGSCVGFIPFAKGLGADFEFEALRICNYRNLGTLSNGKFMWDSGV